MTGLGGLANWATNLATGGNVQTLGELPDTGLLAGGNTKTFAPFTSSSGSGLNPFNGTGTGSNVNGALSQLSGLSTSSMGPFLSNAVQNLINEQGSAAQLGNQANLETAKGNQMLNQATNGSGLFKSQQAMINQAVQSQQQQIGQQLASEGLGNSTLLGSLQGQAKMSGAAAAGQLVQQNISLAQNEQQMGTQAQEAQFSEFSNIASQSAAVQNQLYSQAMQGYGALGSMMQSTTQEFGYSLQISQDMLQMNEAEAGLQLQAQQIGQQAAASESQGFSSMLGGLGSLLGGSGGSGGGLLGGLGGLLGGAGGGIGSLIGAGSAAGGAAGATGAGVDAVVTAVGAAFCEVARTVYGVINPDWLLFRDWMLFRAPKPIRTAYVIYAYRVSRWLKGRPIICRLIRWAMNAILYVDSFIFEDKKR